MFSRRRRDREKTQPREDPSILHLEKSIELSFRNKDLLRQALTHSSYAYENQQTETANNETLEFLGDSVVGLIIADFFYSIYPGLAEGDLSKFKSTAASTTALSQLAKKIRLNKHILLGKGEEKSGGRKKSSILAGAFEALMGAVYLDQGFEKARQFLIRLLELSHKKIKEGDFLINNSKSALQEAFQKMNMPPPVYQTVTTEGPDHKKIFVVEVTLGDIPLAKAKGHSKKHAEQRAAQIALKRIFGRKIKEISPETFLLKKQ